MRAEQGQRTEEYCEDDGGALGQVGRPIDLSRIGRSTVSAVEPRQVAAVTPYLSVRSPGYMHDWMHMIGLAYDSVTTGDI